MNKTQQVSVVVSSSTGGSPIDAPPEPIKKISSFTGTQLIRRTVRTTSALLPRQVTYMPSADLVIVGKLTDAKHKFTTIVQKLRLI